MEVAQTAPISAPAQAPPMAALVEDPTRFEVPLEFSALREIHKGSAGVFIIHIQDPHSNVSGQQNLAGALDRIMTRYGVSLVLSEGGADDCSLTDLKKIAPPEVWKRLAKSYLMDGKITGEEYLNLTSDHPMKIMGLEDIMLYLKSVQSYADLADKRVEILDYLKTIRSALSQLKRRLYPSELAAYEEKKRMNGPANGGDDFESGFRGLMELARNKNVDLSGFSNLMKLVELQLKEKLINFDLANLEQASLVEEISKRGGGEDLKAFLEKNGRMKGAKASQFTYFQNTLNIAKEKGILMTRYPNLVRYGEYLKDFSELDLDQILEELAAAEDRVYVALLASEDQKLIRAIDRYTALLQTAYNIQMSTSEFALFKANEPDFGTIPYLAFINRKLAEEGYFGDLIAYKDLMEKGKQALEAFYDSVMQRDFAFIRNTEQILKDESQKVAVLISGGYHTPHLKKLFKEKGYSYAVLTPQVTSETNQAKYEKLLISPIRPEVKRVEMAQGERRADRSLSALEKDLARTKKTTEGVRPALLKLQADISKVEAARSNASMNREDVQLNLSRVSLYLSRLDSLKALVASVEREQLANQPEIGRWKSQINGISAKLEVSRESLQEMLKTARSGIPAAAPVGARLVNEGADTGTRSVDLGDQNAVNTEIAERIEAEDVATSGFDDAVALFSREREQGGAGSLSYYLLDTAPTLGQLKNLPKNFPFEIGLFRLRDGRWLIYSNKALEGKFVMRNAFLQELIEGGWVDIAMHTHPGEKIAVPSDADVKVAITPKPLPRPMVSYIISEGGILSYNAEEAFGKVIPGEVFRKTREARKRDFGTWLNDYKALYQSGAPIDPFEFYTRKAVRGGAEGKPITLARQIENLRYYPFDGLAPKDAAKPGVSDVMGSIDGLMSSMGIASEGVQAAAESAAPVFQAEQVQQAKKELFGINIRANVLNQRVINFDNQATPADLETREMTGSVLRLDLKKLEAELSDPKFDAIRETPNFKKVDAEITANTRKIEVLLAPVRAAAVDVKAGTEVAAGARLTAFDLDEFEDDGAADPRLTNALFVRDMAVTRKDDILSLHDISPERLMEAMSAAFASGETDLKIAYLMALESFVKINPSDPAHEKIIEAVSGLISAEGEAMETRLRTIRALASVGRRDAALLTEMKNRIIERVNRRNQALPSAFLYFQALESLKLLGASEAELEKLRPVPVELNGTAVFNKAILDMINSIDKDQKQQGKKGRVAAITAAQSSFLDALWTPGSDVDGLRIFLEGVSPEDREKYIQRFEAIFYDLGVEGLKEEAAEHAEYVKRPAWLNVEQETVAPPSTDGAILYDRSAGHPEVNLLAEGWGVGTGGKTRSEGYLRTTKMEARNLLFNLLKEGRFTPEEMFLIDRIHYAFALRQVFYHEYNRAEEYVYDEAAVVANDAIEAADMTRLLEKLESIETQEHGEVRSVPLVKVLKADDSQNYIYPQWLSYYGAVEKASSERVALKIPMRTEKMSVVKRDGSVEKNPTSENVSELIRSGTHTILFDTRTGGMTFFQDARDAMDEMQKSPALRKIELNETAGNVAYQMNGARDHSEQEIRAFIDSLRDTGVLDNLPASVTALIVQDAEELYEAARYDLATGQKAGARLVTEAAVKTAPAFDLDGAFASVMKENAVTMGLEELRAGLRGAAEGKPFKAGIDRTNLRQKTLVESPELKNTGTHIFSDPHDRGVNYESRARGDLVRVGKSSDGRIGRFEMMDGMGHGVEANELVSILNSAMDAFTATHGTVEESAKNAQTAEESQKIIAQYMRKYLLFLQDVYGLYIGIKTAEKKSFFSFSSYRLTLVDYKTMNVYEANMGENPLVIIDGKGKLVPQAPKLTGHIVLGGSVFKLRTFREIVDARFSDPGSVDVTPVGDQAQLLMYTDGLSEAKGVNEEDFGSDKLIEAAEKSAAPERAAGPLVRGETFLGKIIQAVKTHQKSINDDMTAVVHDVRAGAEAYRRRVTEPARRELAKLNLEVESFYGEIEKIENRLGRADSVSLAPVLVKLKEAKAKLGSAVFETVKGDPGYQELSAEVDTLIQNISAEAPLTADLAARNYQKAIDRLSAEMGSSAGKAAPQLGRASASEINDLYIAAVLITEDEAEGKLVSDKPFSLMNALKAFEDARDRYQTETPGAAPEEVPFEIPGASPAPSAPLFQPPRARASKNWVRDEGAAREVIYLNFKDSGVYFRSRSHAGVPAASLPQYLIIPLDKATNTYRTKSGSVEVTVINPKASSVQVKLSGGHEFVTLDDKGRSEAPVTQMAFDVSLKATELSLQEELDTWVGTKGKYAITNARWNDLMEFINDTFPLDLEQRMAVLRHVLTEVKTKGLEGADAFARADDFKKLYRNEKVLEIIKAALKEKARQEVLAAYDKRAAMIAQMRKEHASVKGAERKRAPALYAEAERQLTALEATVIPQSEQTSAFEKTWNEGMKGLEEIPLEDRIKALEEIRKVALNDITRLTTRPTEMAALTPLASLKTNFKAFRARFAAEVRTGAAPVAVVAGARLTDISDIVGKKLMAEFMALNGGEPLRILPAFQSAEGTQAFVEMANRLKDQLAKMSEKELDSYVMVVIERASEAGVEYRIVIDKARTFHGRAIPLLGGHVNINDKLAFLLDFHTQTSQQAVHLDNILLAPELRGKGLASETFSNFAGFLEGKYKGWMISTVAAEEQLRGEDAANFVPSQMAKHFDGHRPNGRELERFKGAFKYLMKAADYPSLYVGEVRRPAGARLVEEGEPDLEAAKEILDRTLRADLEGRNAEVIKAFDVLSRRAHGRGVTSEDEITIGGISYESSGGFKHVFRVDIAIRFKGEEEAKMVPLALAMKKAKTAGAIKKEEAEYFRALDQASDRDGSVVPVFVKAYHNDGDPSKDIEAYFEEFIEGKDYQDYEIDQRYDEDKAAVDAVAMEVARTAFRAYDLAKGRSATDFNKRNFRVRNNGKAVLIDATFLQTMPLHKVLALILQKYFVDQALTDSGVQFKPKDLAPLLRLVSERPGGRRELEAVSAQLQEDRRKQLLTLEVDPGDLAAGAIAEGLKNEIDQIDAFLKPSGARPEEKPGFIKYEPGQGKEAEPLMSELNDRELVLGYVRQNLPGEKSFNVQSFFDERLSRYVVPIPALSMASGTPLVTDQYQNKPVVFIDKDIYEKSKQKGALETLLKDQASLGPERPQGQFLRVAKLINEFERGVTGRLSEFTKSVNKQRSEIARLRGIGFVPLTADEVRDKVLNVRFSLFYEARSPAFAGEGGFIGFMLDYVSKLSDEEFLLVYGHELGHNLVNLDMALSPVEIEFEGLLEEVKPDMSDQGKVKKIFDERFGTEKRSALSGIKTAYERSADAVGQDALKFVNQAAGRPAAAFDTIGRSLAAVTQVYESSAGLQKNPMSELMSSLGVETHPDSFTREALALSGILKVHLLETLGLVSGARLIEENRVRDLADDLLKDPYGTYNNEFEWLKPFAMDGNRLKGTYLTVVGMIHDQMKKSDKYDPNWGDRSRVDYIAKVFRENKTFIEKSGSLRGMTLVPSGARLAAVELESGTLSAVGSVANVVSKASPNRGDVPEEVADSVAQINQKDKDGVPVIVNYKRWPIFELLFNKDYSGRVVEKAKAEKKRFDDRQSLPGSWTSLQNELAAAKKIEDKDAQKVAIKEVEGKFKKLTPEDWPPALILVPEEEARTFKRAQFSNKEGFKFGDNSFAIGTNGTNTFGDQNLLANVKPDEITRISFGPLVRPVVVIDGKRYIAFQGKPKQFKKGNLFYQPYGGHNYFSPAFMAQQYAELKIVAEDKEKKNEIASYLSKQSLDLLAAQYNTEESTGAWQGFVDPLTGILTELVEEMTGFDPEGNPVDDGFPLLGKEAFELVKGARLAASRLIGARYTEVEEEMMLAGLIKHRRAVRSKNVREVADITGLEYEKLRRWLRLKPYRVPEYQIKPRPGELETIDVHARLEANREAIRGVSFAKAIKTIDVPLPVLSLHLQIHPEDVKKFGLAKYAHPYIKQPAAEERLLPRVPRGYKRIVHITEADKALAMAATGLNYEMPPAHRMYHLWSRGSLTRFVKKNDPRLLSGKLRAVVFDVPPYELGIHDRTDAPGTIPAEYVVGVLEIEPVAGARLAAEEDYKKKIYPITQDTEGQGLDWGRLPEETKALFNRYGISDALVKILKQTDGNIWDVLRFGFPIVNDVIRAPGDMENLAPYLMELSNGKYGDNVVEEGLRDLRKAFTADEFMRYLPVFMELAKKSGKDTHDLFFYAIPALKHLIHSKDDLSAIGADLAGWSPRKRELYERLPHLKAFVHSREDLKIVGDDLSDLVSAKPGSGDYHVLNYGVPILENLIGDWKEFKSIRAELGRMLAQYIQKGERRKIQMQLAYHYSLPALRSVIKTLDDVRRVSEIFMELGGKKGTDGTKLFMEVLPASAYLIHSVDDLRAVGNELVTIAKNSGDEFPYSGLADGIDEYRDLIRSVEDLRYFLPGIIIISNQTNISEEAWLEGAFKQSLSAARSQLSPEEFTRFWPGIVGMAQDSGAAARAVLTHGIPAISKLVRSPEDFQPFRERFKRLNAATNDYNRDRIYELFKDSGILLFIQEHGGNVLDHLDYYISQVEKRKNYALQVLEGLFKSLKENIVSVGLPAEERRSIDVFIDTTNAFNPALYRIYKEKGEGRLREILAFGPVILRDEAGPEEIRAFVEKISAEGYDGMDVLVGVIQKAIPVSGASFVKADEVRALLEKYLAAGDRRGDAPKALRDLGRFGGGIIRRVDWVRKAGKGEKWSREVIGLYENLREPDSLKSAEQKTADAESYRSHFSESLRKYLKNPDDEEAGRKVFETFLWHARYSDPIKEKIDQIQGDDYVNLSLLDQIFRDEANLPQLFKSIIPSDVLFDGKLPVQDPKSLLASMKAIWALDAPAAEKALKIEKRIASIRSVEIRSKLLTDKTLDPGLRSLISGVLEKRVSLSIDDVLSRLFGEALNELAKEKDNYKDVPSDRSINLKFQVVKGPAYGLWGLCAGVCIATDVGLWSNKDFYLLAMIDEASQEAVGFVHLFQKEIGGQWHLTAPGIEPSTEFLGHVKAREIYPMIEEAIQTVGKAGKFREVNLPVEPNILTNRHDIHDLIIKRKYEKKTLPEKVRWNTVPEPYLFNEVYVMPLGARLAAGAISKKEMEKLRKLVSAKHVYTHEDGIPYGGMPQVTSDEEIYKYMKSTLDIFNRVGLVSVFDKNIIQLGLLSRYTGNHPGLKRLKKAAEGLELSGFLEYNEPFLAKFSSRGLQGYRSFQESQRKSEGGQSYDYLPPWAVKRYKEMIDASDFLYYKVYESRGGSEGFVTFFEDRKRKDFLSKPEKSDFGSSGFGGKKYTGGFEFIWTENYSIKFLTVPRESRKPGVKREWHGRLRAESKSFPIATVDNPVLMEDVVGIVIRDDEYKKRVLSLIRGIVAEHEIPVFTENGNLINPSTGKVKATHGKWTASVRRSGARLAAVETIRAGEVTLTTATLEWRLDALRVKEALQKIADRLGDPETSDQNQMTRGEGQDVFTVFKRKYAGKPYWAIDRDDLRKLIAYLQMLPASFFGLEALDTDSEVGVIDKNWGLRGVFEKPQSAVEMINKALGDPTRSEKNEAAIGEGEDRVDFRKAWIGGRIFWAFKKERVDRLLKQFPLKKYTEQKAAPPDAIVAFFVKFPDMKGFERPFIKSHWEDITRLRESARERGVADTAFASALPALLKKFGLEWMRANWKSLRELLVLVADAWRVIGELNRKEHEIVSDYLFKADEILKGLTLYIHGPTDLDVLKESLREFMKEENLAIAKKAVSAEYLLERSEIIETIWSYESGVGEVTPDILEAYKSRLDQLRTASKELAAHLNYSNQWSSINIPDLAKRIEKSIQETNQGLSKAEQAMAAKTEKEALEAKFAGWEKSMAQIMNEMVYQYGDRLDRLDVKDLKVHLGEEHGMASITMGGGMGMRMGMTLLMEQTLMSMEDTILVDKTLMLKHGERFTRALNHIVPHEVAHVLMENKSGPWHEVIKPSFEAEPYAGLANAESVLNMARETMIDRIALGLATEVHMHNRNIAAELTPMERAVSALYDTVLILMDKIQAEEERERLGESLVLILARFEAQLREHGEKSPLRDPMKADLDLLAGQVRKTAESQIAEPRNLKTYEDLVAAYRKVYNDTVVHLNPRPATGVSEGARLAATPNLDKLIDRGIQSLFHATSPETVEEMVFKEHPEISGYQTGYLDNRGSAGANYGAGPRFASNKAAARHYAENLGGVSLQFDIKKIQELGIDIQPFGEIQATQPVPMAAMTDESKKAVFQLISDRRKGRFSGEDKAKLVRALGAASWEELTEKFAGARLIEGMNRRDFLRAAVLGALGAAAVNWVPENSVLFAAQAEPQAASARALPRTDKEFLDQARAMILPSEADYKKAIALLLKEVRGMVFPSYADYVRSIGGDKDIQKAVADTLKFLAQNFPPSLYFNTVDGSSKTLFLDNWYQGQAFGEGVVLVGKAHVNDLKKRDHLIVGLAMTLAHEGGVHNIHHREGTLRGAGMEHPAVRAYEEFTAYLTHLYLMLSDRAKDPKQRKFTEENVEDNLFVVRHLADAGFQGIIPRFVTQADGGLLLPDELEAREDLIRKGKFDQKMQEIFSAREMSRLSLLVLLEKQYPGQRVEFLGLYPSDGLGAKGFWVEFTVDGKYYRDGVTEPVKRSDLAVKMVKVEAPAFDKPILIENGADGTVFERFGKIQMDEKVRQKAGRDLKVFLDRFQNELLNHPKSPLAPSDKKILDGIIQQGIKSSGARLVAGGAVKEEWLAERIPALRAELDKMPDRGQGAWLEGKKLDLKYFREALKTENPSPRDVVMAERFVVSEQATALHELFEKLTARDPQSAYISPTGLTREEVTQILGDANRTRDSLAPARWYVEGYEKFILSDLLKEVPDTWARSSDGLTRDFIKLDQAEAFVREYRAQVLRERAKEGLDELNGISASVPPFLKKEFDHLKAALGQDNPAPKDMEAARAFVLKQKATDLFQKLDKIPASWQDANGFNSTHFKKELETPGEEIFQKVRRFIDEYKTAAAAPKTIPAAPAETVPALAPAVGARLTQTPKAELEKLDADMAPIRAEAKKMDKAMTDQDFEEVTALAVPLKTVQQRLNADTLKAVLANDAGYQKLTKEVAALLNRISLEILARRVKGLSVGPDTSAAKLEAFTANFERGLSDEALKKLAADQGFSPNESRVAEFILRNKLVQVLLTSWLQAAGDKEKESRLLPALVKHTAAMSDLLNGKTRVTLPPSLWAAGTPADEKSLRPFAVFPIKPSSGESFDALRGRLVSQLTNVFGETKSFVAEQKTYREALTKASERMKFINEEALKAAETIPAAEVPVSAAIPEVEALSGENIAAKLGNLSHRAEGLKVKYGADGENINSRNAYEVNRLVRAIRSELESLGESYKRDGSLTRQATALYGWLGSVEPKIQQAQLVAQSVGEGRSFSKTFGARLPQAFISPAHAAEQADTDTMTLIARALLDPKLPRGIGEETALQFKAGNALITAVLSKDRLSGEIRFYDPDGKEAPVTLPIPAEAFELAQTKPIVTEAEREAVVGELEKAAALEALDTFMKEFRNFARYNQGLPTADVRTRHQVVLAVPVEGRSPEELAFLKSLFDTMKPHLRNEFFLVFTTQTILKEDGLPDAAPDTDTYRSEALPVFEAARPPKIMVVANPEAAILEKIKTKTAGTLPMPVSKAARGTLQIANYGVAVMLTDMMTGLSEEELKVLAQNSRFRQLLKAGVQDKLVSDEETLKTVRYLSEVKDDLTQEDIAFYRKIVFDFLRPLNIQQLFELARLITKAVGAAA